MNYLSLPLKTGPSQENDRKVLQNVTFPDLLNHIKNYATTLNWIILDALQSVNRGVFCFFFSGWHLNILLKQKRIHDEKNNNQIKTKTTQQRGKKKRKNEEEKEEEQTAQNTQITVYTKSDSVLPQIIIIWKQYLSLTPFSLLWRHQTICYTESNTQIKK